MQAFDYNITYQRTIPNFEACMEVWTVPYRSAEDNTIYFLCSTRKRKKKRFKFKRVSQPAMYFIILGLRLISATGDTFSSLKMPWCTLRASFRDCLCRLGRCSLLFICQGFGVFPGRLE